MIKKINSTLLNIKKENLNWFDIIKFE
jgi:hypothetical protein